MTLRLFSHQLKQYRWIPFRTFAVKRESKHYPLEKIRNIGISAHIDSGKTTLSERVLFYSGRIQAMHEVKGKDSVGATMDSMDLERERGITIQSAATYVEWKGYNINIIDTPGHVDFTVEVERSLRVLDGAILVVCGVGGVQSQTMTVNRQLNRYRVPFLTFINKLDRMNANPSRAMNQLKSKLGHNAAFVQIPIGLEGNFKGLIDLIERKAVYFNGPHGEEVSVEEIPEQYKQETEDRRRDLIETISGVDDALGEMFLNEEIPNEQQIHDAIRRCVISRKFNPIFVGSALKNKGVQPLLDSVNRYLPNPAEVENIALDELGKEKKTIKLDSTRSFAAPFVGFAFKIEAGGRNTGATQLTYVRVYQGGIKRGDTLYNIRTQKRTRVSKLVRMHSNKAEEIDEAYAGDICAFYGLDCATGDTFVNDKAYQISMESIFVPDPVISMSIKCSSTNDVEKFAAALARFTREDPTFRIVYDEDNKESIAMGMGELQLDIYAQRIQREYGVKIQMGKPKVSFRESLASPIKFDYLHKKQSGGAGQYARVIGILEPLSPDKFASVEFSDETSGTNVPSQFIPAIKKGLIRAYEKGSLSGNKISGVKFRLQDGDNHIVDSNELAFMLAADGAIRQTQEYGQWQLIEPVMLVEINAPSEFQSAVHSLVIKRFGIVSAIEPREDWFTMMAEIPLNDMFGFSTDIRSNTQGKGEFSMEYVRYCPVRSDVSSKIIQQYQESLEQTQQQQQQQRRRN
jgi:elongation factor G